MYPKMQRGVFKVGRERGTKRKQVHREKQHERSHSLRGLEEEAASISMCLGLDSGSLGGLLVFSAHRATLGVLPANSFFLFLCGFSYWHSKAL